VGLLLDAAYLTAGLAASPWLLFKLASDRRFRHRLGERFGGMSTPPGDGPLVWVHAASVGEVNLVKPLLKRLGTSKPSLRFLVTTNTMAGRENAEKAGMSTSYAPLDLGCAVSRALKRAKPAAVILVELEVWPNFAAACAKRGVPLAVVNGRMTERSFGRYRRFRGLFGAAFRSLAAAGAQSEESAARLRELGAPAVVTGNLKWDAGIAFEPAEEERLWRERLGLGDAPVWVGGSTHEPEERIVAETYRQLKRTHPGLRLVLAPRHLERADEAAKAVESLGLPCY
jgi:3-deoxy-D-manno-octulosonic-acid transferase